MAARPQQLLESVSHEALGPNIAPDSDVNEDRRLEAPARFDGIHGYDVAGRVIASSIWHGRSTA